MKITLNKSNTQLHYGIDKQRDSIYIVIYMVILRSGALGLWPLKFKCWLVIVHAIPITWLTVMLVIRTRNSGRTTGVWIRSRMYNESGIKFVAPLELKISQLYYFGCVLFYIYEKLDVNINLNIFPWNCENIRNLLKSL